MLAIDLIKSSLSNMSYDDVKTIALICDLALENAWTFEEAYDTTNQEVLDLYDRNIFQYFSTIKTTRDLICARKIISTLLAQMNKSILSVSQNELFKGLKAFIDSLDFGASLQVVKICVHAIEHNMSFLIAYEALTDVFVVQINEESHSKFFSEITTTAKLIDLMGLAQDHLELYNQTENILRGMGTTNLCSFLHVASDAVRQDISFSKAYEDLGVVILPLEDEDGTIPHTLTPLRNPYASQDLIKYIQIASELLHKSVSENIDPELRAANTR